MINSDDDRMLQEIAALRQLVEGWREGHPAGAGAAAGDGSDPLAALAHARAEIARLEGEEEERLAGLRALAATVAALGVPRAAGDPPRRNSPGGLIEELRAQLETLIEQRDRATAEQRAASEASNIAFDRIAGLLRDRPGCVLPPTAPDAPPALRLEAMAAEIARLLDRQAESEATIARLSVGAAAAGELRRDVGVFRSRLSEARRSRRRMLELAAQLQPGEPAPEIAIAPGDDDAQHLALAAARATIDELERELDFGEPRMAPSAVPRRDRRWTAVLNRRRNHRLVVTADRLRDRGDSAAAAAAYARAYAAQPHRIDLCVQMGNMLKDSGQFDAAERAYGEAAQHSPTDPDIVIQLGHLFGMSGRPHRARAAYRRAERLIAAGDDDTSDGRKR